MPKTILETIPSSSEGKKSITRRRFKEFASLEFDGTIYMTPRDLIESILNKSPRPKFGRKQIDGDKVEELLLKTPNKRCHEEYLLTKIENNGIISFVEYAFVMFLLKNPVGLKVTFRMFDVDQDKTITRDEFMEVLAYGNSAHNTTILAHLFGYSQTESLTLDELETFSQGLQTEFRRLEFNEFSKGLNTISSIEFATLVLKNHTNTPPEPFIQRLMEKNIDNEISFDECTQFHSLLSNMRRFVVAIQMHTLAGVSITKDEFIRAVRIATGHTISTNLTDILFGMFDQDGDHMLSYKEFVSIMKPPFTAHLTSTRNDQTFSKSWKSCVRNEMQFIY